MNRHRKSILIHGYGIPAALAVTILLVLFQVRSRVGQELAKRETSQQELRTVKAQVSLVEKFMQEEDRRTNLTNWEEQGKEDFFHKFTQTIDEALSALPEDALRRVEMGQATASGTIARPTELPHSRVALTFEGHFREMQSLLATLESEMPALLLENLEVSRGGEGATSGADKAFLVFRITYLHWNGPALRS